MPDSSLQPGRRLMGDVRRLISDAEALLGATASSAGEEIGELRFKLQSTLSQAKHNLRDAQDAVVHRAKGAVYVTDDYVHDHPWKVIAAAAGISLLLGLLIARR